MLASELIRNYDKSSCLKSSLLKIDIRKAFDTVCWDFVLKILEAQNFPPLFRSWIKECMTSPRFSISINGELAGFFEGKKGLRQGDSISPYLFIMIMEVLSRLLDVGAVEGKFSAHPLCTSPPLTHLAFADDLLVFSDGSQHSLLGIMGILSQFHSLSGLDMNPAKSELFFGGLSVSEAAQISGVVGVKLGTFPSRYLGLPLNPTKLSLSTLQPFLQKFTSQLHSWTSKFLSYAGRIRLIVSVIYGKVNFWSQVFVLPKGFYKKVDSLCAAFLWKNDLSSARGARVAWRDLCKSKEEGGLGIRSLEEFAIVFCLKQVWQLFTRTCSFWVMWLDHNIFGRRNYWLMEPSPRVSWNLRKMLEIKSVFSGFIRCQLGNGLNASFWFDDWTSLGPLYSLFGETGPRVMNIRKDASVFDATRDGHWVFQNARSAVAEQLLTCLTTISPPSPSGGSDLFQWKQPTGTYSETFSTKGTWQQLREVFPRVSWHKAVWFRESVPRYSFIQWIANLGRLTTRDRLRQWGMNVPAACVLCSTGLDSHTHLFFECEFSSSIWVSLSSRIARNPPRTLLSAASWALNVQFSPPFFARKILKLLLQSSIYMIWKERNNRVFSGNHGTLASTKSLIDITMRNRLISFSPEDHSHRVSLLSYYFGCIQAPL